MEQQKHWKTTERRARIIREITLRYYEEGNLRKCYKAIWRKYINPIYPMSYQTYINLLGMPTSKEDAPPPTAQKTLFDFLDEL